MNRSRSSSAWLNEHVHDAYVQKARAEGYRSRASYKLMEIDDKDRLIRSGDLIVDLGAAPGGWSQVAAKRLQGKGRVIAVDLLEMEPLRGATFLQGDFREQEILEQLEKLLDGERLGLVLSANGWVLFFPIWRPISRVSRSAIRRERSISRNWVWTSPGTG